MRAVVALGSNLGDRAAHLQSGLRALADLGVVAPSPLTVETADESGIGPDYLNSVALLDTPLDDPCRLLEALLGIELRLGRDRSRGRNTPRTLDLDLIVVEGRLGSWRWATPPGLLSLGAELNLELPHPRAGGRAFVMQPLGALARTLGGNTAWMSPPPAP